MRRNCGACSGSAEQRLASWRGARSLAAVAERSSASHSVHLFAKLPLATVLQSLHGESLGSPSASGLPACGEPRERSDDARAHAAVAAADPVELVWAEACGQWIEVADARFAPGLGARADPRAAGTERQRQAEAGIVAAQQTAETGQAMDHSDRVRGLRAAALGLGRQRGERGAAVQQIAEGGANRGRFLRRAGAQPRRRFLHCGPKTLRRAMLRARTLNSFTVWGASLCWDSRGARPITATPDSAG